MTTKAEWDQIVVDAQLGSAEAAVIGDILARLEKLEAPGFFASMIAKKPDVVPPLPDTPATTA